MGIHAGRKRDKLASLPHLAQPGYLSAWAQWFAQQDTFGPGWLIVQLEAGEWPPDAVATSVLELYRRAFGPAPPATEAKIRLAVSRAGGSLRDLSLWQIAFSQAGRDSPAGVLSAARELHRAPPDAPAAEIPPDDAGAQLQQFWQQVLAHARRQMTRSAFNRWLKNTRPLALEDGELTIAAPDRYAAEWLDARLRPVLEPVVALLSAPAAGETAAPLCPSPIRALRFVAGEDET